MESTVEVMMLSRRYLLRASLAALVAAALPSAALADRRFPVRLSEAEWRRRLGPSPFAVLRRHATERPHSSPLDQEKRRGTYHCIGCGQPLFASTAKFESGTGWPSFFMPVPRTIGTAVDNRAGFPRTEVHCARCGGHLGHVFDDGPKPTGKRYRMNGVALRFRPAYAAFPASLTARHRPWAGSRQSAQW